MNYRHIYHAGNFADVFKHVVLVGLLEALKAKDRPICYLDTHAGAGQYALQSAEAAKSKEFQQGAQPLFNAVTADPLIAAYVNLLARFNPDPAKLGIYPGSPMIAATLMRPNDMLILCETQAAESDALRLEFAQDHRVHVHRRDGYAAMNALLPPKPSAGLALIDPPFEAQAREFDLIVDALEGALGKWPRGVYAVWYPIKSRNVIKPFYRWLSSCSAQNALTAEILVHPVDSPLRLNGCGLAVLNAPYRFDSTLQRVLPELMRHLKPNGFQEWEIAQRKKAD